MKYRWLLIMILLVIFSTGCSQIQDQNSNDGLRRIVAPKTDLIPITGKWEVVKELGNEQSQTSEGMEWIGKKLEFTNEKVVIGDYTLKNPGFKIRTVNTEEYFLFNHKSFGKDVSISSIIANVVTITEMDKFYCEILEVNNDNLILEMNNFNLLMKKSAEKKATMSQKVMLQSEKESSMSLSVESNIESGVLLGIRTPTNKTTNSAPKYTYRTLWIAANNHKLHNIIETNNIVFPRKSGFWEIKISRQKDGESYKDKIDKHNITMNIQMNEISGVMLRKMISDVVIEDNVINYIGNDYISIENKLLKDKQSLNTLKIIPIDSLPNKIAIKLVDLMGVGSSELADKNMQMFLQKLKMETSNIVDENQLSENIGLVRNSGHWYFNGRINYYEKNKIVDKNYLINLIPPKSLIFYDELYVKWTDIKSAAPDAIDAFTSPNKDIALVITKKNKLIIYELQNQTLAKEPLKTINLKKGERVVMAEWATGSYVDNWEKTIQSIK